MIKLPALFIKYFQIPLKVAIFSEGLVKSELKEH